ncbi:interaptin [hydrothermal vent metagenome]|uniref:Interaptin n=1 Tax=hydrothermal vent metagenome TaxID=652676 RepID=A0A1W1CM97_9ZZZZ
MFDIDLVIAFAFMALLFLRHVAILKKPNKINYAPLMIAVGVIATLIHFVMHPDPSNIVLLLRESLMPLLAAMILYIIMNILNQTKESQSAKLHNEFTQVLVQEITQLKKFILELEVRMREYSESDRRMQLEIQEKFTSDVQALEAILANQMEFAKKFETIEEGYASVTKSFTHFSEVQLPELDNVVHKHIDILRLAEQDHYNKLTQLLEKAGESRYDIAEDIEMLKSSLASMKELSDTVAKTIVEKTFAKLSSVTQEFEAQTTSLKLQSEGIKTTLYEDETLLSNIRAQSEMIMKQMRLSANKMEELQQQTSSLAEVSLEIKELVNDIEKIKSDYVTSQAQLMQLSNSLRSVEDESFKTMEEKIEALSTKIDEAIKKLSQHYHITNENITESVKIMAKKAQLQKGYTELGD